MILGEFDLSIPVQRIEQHWKEIAWDRMFQAIARYIR